MDARSALLAAARAKIAEKGFAATSMDEVRRAAEVSNGSLFHHFPTKNHLARALYLAALTDYQRGQLEILRSARSAEDGVVRLVEAHIDWVLANRDDARILVELRDATAIDGDGVDWKDFNKEAFDALRTFVRRSVDAGEMADLPLDVWTALVFAPVLQLTRGWATKPARKVAPAVRRALAHGAWAAVASRKERHHGR